MRALVERQRAEQGLPPRRSDPRVPGTVGDFLNSDWYRLMRVLEGIARNHSDELTGKEDAA